VTAIVFCGPTLERAEVEAVLPEATVVGPAAAGDVYRAASRKPSAIGLIDGYFDHRLSVWHKEILWALSSGIRVYGSASMGALRAVELASFGMVGVGKIFEQYASGALEDDDEVAVVHEAAEDGYRSRSDALVNMRATLEAARRVGAISAESEARLLEWAKGRFYAERSYAAMLHASGSILAPEQEATLRTYLRQQAPTNQKRLDALAMLDQMSNDASPSDGSVSVEFRFAYTNAWHVFRQKAAESAPRNVAAEPVAAAEPPPEDHDFMAENAGMERLRRCPPELADRTWIEALERALALVLAEDDGPVDVSRLNMESEAFRRVRRLLSDEHLRTWMRQNDLDVESFSSLIYEEVLVGRHRAVARRLGMLQVANTLRSSSDYGSVKDDET